MKKKSKIFKISLIALSLLILIILYQIFQTILFPAYVSYTFVCSPQVFNESFSEKYAILGTAQFNEETNETEIKVYETESPEINQLTLKHELIHAAQNERSPMTCNNVYLREAEAYTFQYLPDKLFVFFYQ